MWSSFSTRSPLTSPLQQTDVYKWPKFAVSAVVRLGYAEVCERDRFECSNCSVSLQFTHAWLIWNYNNSYQDGATVMLFDSDLFFLIIQTKSFQFHTSRPMTRQWYLSFMFCSTPHVCRHLWSRFLTCFCVIWLNSLCMSGLLTVLLPVLIEGYCPESQAIFSRCY